MHSKENRSVDDMQAVLGELNDDHIKEDAIFFMRISKA